MISLNNEYQTRDGREVRLYTADGVGGHAIHGAIKARSGAGWIVASWYSDGRAAIRGVAEHPHDLVPVPKTHTLWINVYRETTGAVSYSASHKSRESADASAFAGERIACVKIDVEEGQFDTE